MHPLVSRPAVPGRALLLSAAAFAVPLSGQIVFAEGASEYELLLWVLALIPAFLLAYYRGWRGVAVSCTIGMAVLALSQGILIARGGEVRHWGLFFSIFVMYLSVSLGVGWVSERLHQAREEAEARSFIDPLTLLPNRSYADRVLAGEFAAAQRGRRVVLVAFDVDHFKEYNDRHGHPAGDEALRAFARVLERNTRQMNISARYGGEEFISVLTDADPEGALVFVERVRQGIGSVPLPGGPLTVSAGIAAYHPCMTGPLEMYDAADRALYEAKRLGRNRVCIAERSMSEPANFALA